MSQNNAPIAPHVNTSSDSSDSEVAEVNQRDLGARHPITCWTLLSLIKIMLMVVVLPYAVLFAAKYSAALGAPPGEWIYSVGTSYLCFGGTSVICPANQGCCEPCECPERPKHFEFKPILVHYSRHIIDFTPFLSPNPP